MFLESDQRCHSSPGPHLQFRSKDCLVLERSRLHLILVHFRLVHNLHCARVLHCHHWFRCQHRCHLLHPNLILSSHFFRSHWPYFDLQSFLRRAFELAASRSDSQYYLSCSSFRIFSLQYLLHDILLASSCENWLCLGFLQIWTEKHRGILEYFAS